MQTRNGTEPPDFLIREAPYQGEPFEERTLRDYLNVLLRRRRILAVAFCVLFLGAILKAFTASPVYEASATLRMREARKTNPYEEILAWDRNPVDAELEIIRSRTSAEEVVRRLHLDWEISKKSKGLDVKILDFASSAERPEYQVEVTGADAYRVRDPEGKGIGAGKVGALFREKGLSLLVKELRGKPGDGFGLTLVPLADAAAGVMGGVRATEVGKYTNVLRVSYSDTSPERARDAANTLVQVYLDRVVSFKTQEASRSVEFIGNQLNNARTELDDAEKQLEAYKSGSGVVQLDAEATALIQKISQTETARAEVAIQRRQAEVALASLKDAVAQGKTYSPAVMRDDPLFAGMAGKLAELEIQKRTLVTDFTEQHPAVRTVQGQIDEIHRKIQATYETALKNLARQEAGIQADLASYEKRLRSLPEAERQLARHMRYTKVNADIYTFLLQKHEEARISRASTLSNIDIIDPAITPQSPISPNRPRILFLGALLGLVFGVGLAFVQEHLDDTIKDPEAAKRELGMPLLALIPYIPPKNGNGKKELQATLVTRTDPKSPVAEAFRALRTSVHFSSVSRKRQVILVTSTFPKEGKTTIAANLALTLSQTGARVLLVDCDLRHPTIHEIYSHTRVPGVSEILAGDVEIGTALHSTEAETLKVLTSGTIPPNPAELLGSDAMTRFVEKLRGQFDHVVIDTPPTLAVTDALLLAVLCDTVLVVVESGRVPVKAARRMREILESVGAPVAGIVMNDRDEKSQERYGSYGYRKYGYHSYGYPGEEGGGKKSPRWKRWLRS